MISTRTSAETIRRLWTLAASGKHIDIAVFPRAEHGIFEYEIAADGTRISTRNSDGYFAMRDFILGGRLQRSYERAFSMYRAAERAQHRFIFEKRFALVRREWESQGSVSQCCRGDEGWPLEVGVQKLASNQAVLLWLQGHGSERLSKNRSKRPEGES